MTPPLERPLPPLTSRVSLLYGSLYLHFGFLAFLPLWLSSRGMSPKAIGILVALPLILRILTVAPVAGAAGRTGRVRLVMLCATLVSAVLIALLGAASGTVAVVLVVLLFALAWDQLPVLADAYAVMAVRQQSLDFGRMRVWGSIAVIASSLLGGWVIGKAHISALPLMVAGLLLLPAMVIYLLLPPDRLLIAAAHEDDEAGGRADWRQLIGNRPLMAGMLTVSLVVGSAGIFSSFSVIQWTAAGISASMIGMLNATAVVSEIAFFWFGAQLLGGRDPRWMLVAAALASALRWVLMATSPALPVLVFAQLLQGVGATGAILGMMMLISQRTSLRLTPAAQGMNAVLIGVILAGITAVSGFIWTWGPAPAYLAMTAVALVSLAPLALLRDAPNTTLTPGQGAPIIPPSPSPEQDAAT